MNCQECKHYLNCRQPCQEIDDFINQDDNEDAWLKIRFTDKIERCDLKNRDGVSTTEAILQNYFIDRMEPKEIAEKYFKSRQYVYWVIKKYTSIIAANIKKSVK